MRRIALPLLLPLAAGACIDYAFERKTPESLKEVNRIVPAAKPTPADILFVVDNSGSMADEQENLARNFERFINVLTQSSGDYQMAIVTTDLDRGNSEYGGLVTSQFKNVVPNTLVRIDSSTCQVTDIPHGCFRGPDPSTRIIKSTTLNREQQINAFKQNVLVGSCGSGNEMGLGAAVRALERTVAGDCNAGFLRPDANLVIVIVSDEEDSDFAPNDPNQPPYPTYYAKAISHYVSRISAFKDPARTRVATIVGSVEGEAQRCGAQASCGGTCGHRPPDGSGNSCTPGGGQTCPSGEVCLNPGRCENADLQFWINCWWCSYYNTPDCCSANASGRYVEFARAMETAITRAVQGIPVSNCRAPVGTRSACLIDSICQQEFDATLSRIARDLVVTNEFILEPPAKYPPGVVVKLNGTQLVQCTSSGQVDCGFTVNLNGEGLGISISVPAAGEGDQLEIYYITPE